MVKFSKMLLLGLAVLSVGRFECADEVPAGEAPKPKKAWSKSIGKFLKGATKISFDVITVHAIFSALRAIPKGESSEGYGKRFVSKLKFEQCLNGWTGKGLTALEALIIIVVLNNRTFDFKDTDSTPILQQLSASNNISDFAGYIGRCCSPKQD